VKESFLDFWALQPLREWARQLRAQRPLEAALLSGTTVLFFISVLDGAFSYGPALRCLYILPVWVATRLSGRRAGITMVGLTSLIATCIDVFANQTVKPAEAPKDFALLFAALGIVMMVIAHVEGSLNRHRLLAMCDPLTGLLNRRALVEWARVTLHRVLHRNEPMVAMMIDCDDFKGLNDNYGHHAGDHVLRLLARVLENETRSTDLVARLGGDEFLVILHGATPEIATKVMQRIENRFETLVSDAGYECTVSIGSTQMRPDMDSLDALIEHADRAMYLRKEQRRNRRLVG